MIDERDDLMAIMDQGLDLMKSEQWESALKCFLRCWDDGTSDDSFYAVRLSFLPSYIKKLGESYPKALDEMSARIKVLREAVESRPTFEQEQDYKALCRDFLYE